MAPFDPAYVAAIEREQQRLIRDELERLRTAPPPAPVEIVLTDLGAIAVVRQALAVIEREQRVSKELREALSEIEAL